VYSFLIKAKRCTYFLRFSAASSSTAVSSPQPLSPLGARLFLIS
jgi:hypothetical protein